jgi:cytochrome c
LFIFFLRIIFIYKYLFIFFPLFFKDGDADAGRAVFDANCAACHALDGDAKSASAPPLGGIIGRKTGTTAFAYSKTLKTAGFDWSEKHLWVFL